MLENPLFLITVCLLAIGAWAVTQQVRLNRIEQQVREQNEAEKEVINYQNAPPEEGLNAIRPR